MPEVVSVSGIMERPLRFLCFGVGAIGTYLGGSLAAAGHRVVFLERPELAAILREHGLHLSLGDVEHHISEVLMAGSPEEALSQGPFDAAIFAIKSFDTEAALQSLTSQTAALPPFICFQNGVENEPQLSAVLGEDRVIPGTVTSAVTRRGIGSILLERKRGIGIAGRQPLVARLVQALDGAGLNSKQFSNGRAMKWSKMLTNLIGNATSAILDMTPAEIFSDPRLFRVEICQLRETLRVMKAMDLPVVDLPGTPVRMLAFAASGLPLQLSRPLLQRAIGRGRGAKMPSFHIDLHAGRGKSEVDYLNGAVVRFGEQWGVSTPVNRVLNETLLALTHGERKVDDFSRKPERLLALIEGQ